MNTKEKPVNFQLRGITTDQFAIIDAAYKQGEQTELVTSFNFNWDPPAKVISVKANFRFEQNTVPFLLIEVSCHFGIEENSWNEMIETTNQLIVPKAFAIHLAMITTGTARGVLHAKIERTQFTQFMVPPIDLTAIFTNDVTVVKEETSLDIDQR